jgi:hypothetical protein
MTGSAAHQPNTSYPLNRNLWQERYLQPAMIAVLVTALMTGLATLLRLLSPNGPWTDLLAFVFFIALEVSLTTRWLAERGSQINGLAYRFAELATIVVLLRLYTWSISDNPPMLADVRDIILRPLAIFDATFVIFLLAGVITWERAIGLSRVFNQLALSRSEIAYFDQPALQRKHEPVLADRTELLQSYYRQWGIGGVLMGFLATITSFELQFLGQASGGALDLRNISRLGLAPEMLAALLIYFVGGLWLASQGRMAMMRARWLAEGIEADTDLSRSWYRSSLLVVLVVATVAALLPIGSTAAASHILQAVLLVLVLLANFLLLLISMPIIFLVSLLRGGEGGEELQLNLDELLTPPTPAETNETQALVVGTVFWLIVIAISGLAIFFFLRERGVQVEPGRAGQVWQRFLAWLRSWWAGTTVRVHGFGQDLQARLRRPTGIETPQPPWHFIRLHALSPRDQIRFFYLSTVRRAGQRGVEREGSETPLEYVEELKASWPEADEDVNHLTQAFLEARYSARPIAPDKVQPLKKVWQRVSLLLRRPRK